MKNYEAILLILIDAIISEIMKNYVAEIMFHMESSITNIFENSEKSENLKYYAVSHECKD